MCSVPLRKREVRCPGGCRPIGRINLKSSRRLPKRPLSFGAKLLSRPLCHTADTRHCMPLRDSVTILSLACGTLLGSEQAGVLRVQLFDSLTGFKVRGWVKVEGPESITFRTDSSGTRTLQLR